MGQSVRVNGIDQTDTLDITIRKTYAQTKALFIVVKNLQVEVQSLRAEIAKVSRLFLATLDDREAVAYATSVVKDTKFGQEHSDKKKQ